MYCLYVYMIVFSNVDATYSWEADTIEPLLSGISGTESVPLTAFLWMISMVSTKGALLVVF